MKNLLFQIKLIFNLIYIYTKIFSFKYFNNSNFKKKKNL